MVSADRREHDRRVEQDALTGLTAAFGALMPAVASPQLPHKVAVDPLRVAPAGLGGYVGLSATPPGEIRAHRVTALARVTVGTTDADQLDAAVTKVTSAIVAGDRAQQRSHGLLEAELEDIGPQVAVSASGVDRFSRDVRFRLLFEHVQLPEASEDVIETIPLHAVPPAAADRTFRIAPALPGEPDPPEGP